MKDERKKGDTLEGKRKSAAAVASKEGGGGKKYSSFCRSFAASLRPAVDMKSKGEGEGKRPFSFMTQVVKGVALHRTPPDGKEKREGRLFPYWP